MIALRRKFNVIGALMLRDMRTRFGSSHLGYLIAILWPFSHLVIMVSAMAYSRRFTTMGGDPVVFAITGILPYILCLYPARMMGYAIEVNKGLLFFPVVRVIDIIFSRAIIELLTATVVVVLIFSCGLALGFDLVPTDIPSLISGILATVFLSLSMGFFANIAAAISPSWRIVLILSVIVMYLTSGVVVPFGFYPREIQNIVVYNPLFHSVEWLRSAYYDGDSYIDYLSKTYLVSFSIGFLFFSLLGERFLRGKVLSS